MKLQHLSPLAESQIDSKTGKINKGYGLIAFQSNGEMSYDDLEQVEVYLDEIKFQKALVLNFREYVERAESQNGRDADDIYNEINDIMDIEDVYQHEYYDAWNENVWFVDKF